MHHTKQAKLVFGTFLIVFGYIAGIPVAANEITIKTPEFRSVMFVDGFHGWITGTRGVFYTSNGGKTWQMKLSGIKPTGDTLENRDIGSIAWADKNNIIVNSGEGCLFGNSKGNEWRATIIPQANGIETIRFANKKIGWAIGGIATIFRTIDGGTSRHVQKEDHLNSANTMFVSSNSEVWIGGADNYLATTKDAGKNWKDVESISGKGPSDVWCIRFFGNGVGWVLGLGNQIFSTSDSGRNWNSWTLSKSKYYSLLLGISFSDQKEGWIVGCKDDPGGGEEGIILHTEDEGRNWIRLSYPSKECLFDVQALAGGRAWVVGEFGLVMFSEDHGKSWKVFDLK